MKRSELQLMAIRYCEKNYRQVKQDRGELVSKKATEYLLSKNKDVGSEEVGYFIDKIFLIKEKVMS